jgi:predicted nucleic acid-binding protein
MQVLVDTNVLIRAVGGDSGQRQVANDAVRRLRGEHHRLVVVPQVFFEWWVVATRPKNVNGLGMNTRHALAVLTTFERLFPVLPDDASTYSLWRQMVVQYGVIGKQSHDLRLVAAMQLHGIDHFLTFNGADFARYAHLTVIAPGDVV